MKPVIIVAVNGNVYQIAIASPSTAPNAMVTMDDGRVFVRTRIKYRNNGQIIYYYKQVDTTLK